MKAEVVEILASLAQKNGGILTPDAVVKEAKSQDSPLHDLFEWDSQVAAHAYRLDQARALIRSVRVVVSLETKQVRTVGYVRNPEAEADEQGYVSTTSLIGNEELAHRTLVDEFSRAGAALRRARELAVVFDMVDQIDAATEVVEVLKASVVSRVTENRLQS